MRKWLPRAYGTHHNTASTARDDKNPTREFRRINPGLILLKLSYGVRNKNNTHTNTYIMVTIPTYVNTIMKIRALHAQRADTCSTTKKQVDGAE